MLQTLREYPVIRKGVLWLVVLGLFSGIGIGVTAVYDALVTGKGIAGPSGPWAIQIEGETITPSMVQKEVDNLGRQLAALGQPESPELRKRLFLEAKARLVNRVLELHEARSAGLTVGDDELSEAITSIPGLQRNGRFVGTEEYRQALARIGSDIASFESQQREELLVAKWEALVGGGAVVTDREVEVEYDRRNERVRFEYVLIEPGKFPTVATPADSELKAFYDAHPEKYPRGESRRARYVVLDEKSVQSRVTEPTEEEIRTAYEANRTKYTGTLEQSREEVRKQLSYQRAQSEIEVAAEEFRKSIAPAGDLGAAAAKSGLGVEDTGFVVRGPESLSKLGTDFVEALFRAEEGVAEGPIRMLRGNAVLLLSGVQPPRRATLEEARSEILSEVTKQKGHDAAFAAARRAVASSGGSDLSSVARSLGSTVQSGSVAGRDEPLPGIGYDPGAQRIAFSSEPGRIAEPLAASSGSILVLKVLERVRPDPSGLAADREKLRAELRRGRQYLLVSSILEASRKRTGLRNNDEYDKQFGGS